MADNKLTKDETELVSPDGTEISRLSVSPYNTGLTNRKITFANFKAWVISGIASTFAALTDAYDPATSPIGSVPANDGSGNLIPLQILGDDGFTIAVDVATNAALSGTWNYSNGTAGVGATLTRSTNGAIGNIDGVSAIVGRTVLIKNFTGNNRHKNGPYVVTVAGGAGAQASFTRLTNSDESSELENQVVIPALGTANKGLIFRQITPAPVVGTTNIVYQTNAVANPSVAPTSITVAAAQTLVTNGNVVVGRTYSVTNSTQVQNAADRIWVTGATPDSFSDVALYIDNIGGTTNKIRYILDDVPTDLLIYREDNNDNRIPDIGIGYIGTFPFNGVYPGAGGQFYGNRVNGYAQSFSFDRDCVLQDNEVGVNAGFSNDNAASIITGNRLMYGSSMGGTGQVNINGNYIGDSATVNVTPAGATATFQSNIVGKGSGVTCTNQISGCTIGQGCTINDGGFDLVGCTFPQGINFTADRSYTNIDFSEIDSTRIVVQTVDGDSVNVLDSDKILICTQDNTGVALEIHFPQGNRFRQLTVIAVSVDGAVVKLVADGGDTFASDSAPTHDMTPGLSPASVTCACDAAGKWYTTATV